MNYSELQKDARYLALGDADNSTDYPDSDLLRNINNWYDLAAHWAWNASGTWGYDDSSKDDLPIATTDLVDGQEQYTIPSAARSIEIAVVKNADGDWDRLSPLDTSQIEGAPEELYEDDGLPYYYDMDGESIWLYPAPDNNDVTTSSGLRVYLSRTVDEFTGSSGETPGFDRTFHRLLSYGAALDYCRANELASKEVNLRRTVYGGGTSEGLKQKFARFISTRNKEFKQRMSPRNQNYE